MKIGKKTLCLILMGTMVFASLFAGGKSDSKGGAKTLEWKIWTDAQIPEEVFKEAIDHFVAANPNHKISFEKFPGAQREEKMALAKEADELPALFITTAFTSMDEVHLGNCVALTDLVNEMKDDLYASTLPAGQIANDYYLLPVYTTTVGMLYNADLFKEAGLDKFIVNEDKVANWTLDEFENEILPALKKSLAGTGKYPLSIYAGNNQADTFTLNLLTMYGGRVIKNGRVRAADDPSVIRAANKLEEWVRLGYGPSNASSKLATECVSDFQSGLSAVAFGEFLNYTTNMEQFAKGAAKPFTMRVATTPGSNLVSSYVSGALVFNRPTAEVEAAKEFLRFIRKNGDLNKLASAGMPAFKSANPSAIAKTYLSIDSQVYSFNENVPGYVRTRAFFFPSMQEILNGGDAKAAFTTYQTRANEIIDEFTKSSKALNK